MSLFRLRIPLPNSYIYTFSPLYLVVLSTEDTRCSGLEPGICTLEECFRWAGVFSVRPLHWRYFLARAITPIPTQASVPITQLYIASTYSATLTRPARLHPFGTLFIVTIEALVHWGGLRPIQRLTCVFPDLHLASSISCGLDWCLYYMWCYIISRT